VQRRRPFIRRLDLEAAVRELWVAGAQDQIGLDLLAEL
jgi:hypothetical protein